MTKWLVRTGLIGVVLVFSQLTFAADGDWPQWRGPASDGHSAERDVPVKWDDSSVVWKCDLPGSGQSSPVIAGNWIFLTAALESGRQRVVFCVDRETGRIAWQETVWSGEPEKSHVMNGWASATCATDGQHVVAFFGQGGLHGFDVAGKKLWSKDLGQFSGPWGAGASPLIVGKLVIQNCETEGVGSIAAFDVATGEVKWQTPRDPPQRGGWSSPIVVSVGDRQEVVLNGFNGVTGYDLATGKKLWFCKSFAGRGEPTATLGHGLLFLVNGQPGDFYAVRPGGEGNVSDSHLAWHAPRKAGRDQPSPIVIGDFVIVSSMNGIANCYDTKTGRELWTQRLEGEFTSSPIAANGLAYFQSNTGETVVIKPGPTPDVVARNTIPAGTEEIFRASLAPSHGQMFSRSNSKLYCLKSH